MDAAELFLALVVVSFCVWDLYCGWGVSDTFNE